MGRSSPPVWSSLAHSASVLHALRLLANLNLLCICATTLRVERSVTQSPTSRDSWLKVFWKLSAPHLLLVTMAFRPHFLCWAALSLVAWLPLRAMNTEGGGDDGVRPRGGRQHAYVDDGTDPSRSRGDLQRPSSSSPPPHPGAGLPSSSSLQSLGASSSSCPSNLRPWSPRTVALYMAAVWDENFSLAAQFDPTECNSFDSGPLVPRAT